MEKSRVKISGDELDEVEGDNSTFGRLLAGVKGKVTIKTPFGVREIHKVKNSKGKVLKDDKHPENVGKVEKPKKEKE